MGSPGSSRTTGGEGKLAFIDVMDSFDASSSHHGILKSLASQHRPHSLFDFSMILFDPVIQGTVHPHSELSRERGLFLSLRGGRQRGV
jgi:hypothetical protein